MSFDTAEERLGLLYEGGIDVLVEDDQGGTSTIRGIFQTEPLVEDVSDIGIDGLIPIFICRPEDVVGVDHQWKFTITDIDYWFSHGQPVFEGFLAIKLTQDQVDFPVTP